jgi:hypothetical protein
MLTTQARQTLDSLFFPEDVVLVAPLNWGLGHAARCIPIVHYLQSRCHQVVLASDGIALHLLQKECPGISAVALPSYHVSYRFSNIATNIAVHSPGILAGVAGEQRKLRSLIRHFGITAVLSDNRLGMVNKRTRNYYMTHQAAILHSNKWIAGAGNLLHHFFIRRFDGCILPDYGDLQQSLAPALSHAPLPVTRHFIGPLSRIDTTTKPIKWDIVVMLSGPEPQRTILEKELSKVLIPFFNTRILVIRGSMQNHNPWPASVEIENIATTEIIAEALGCARLLIARPGYSTLMDVIALSLSAIFIPTPGQTEQEYLARHHAENPRFTILQQNQINNIEKTIKSLI